MIGKADCDHDEVAGCGAGDMLDQARRLEYPRHAEANQQQRDGQKKGRR
jgi:hypothetical protein